MMQVSSVFSPPNPPKAYHLRAGRAQRSSQEVAGEGGTPLRGCCGFSTCKDSWFHVQFARNLPFRLRVLPVEGDLMC